MSLVFRGTIKRLHIGGDTEENWNVSPFMSLAFGWNRLERNMKGAHTGKGSHLYLRCFPVFRFQCFNTSIANLDCLEIA